MQTSSRLSKHGSTIPSKFSCGSVFYAIASRKQIKTIYESIKTYVNRTINVHSFFTAPFPSYDFSIVFVCFFWVLFGLLFWWHSREAFCKADCTYSVVSRIFYALLFAFSSNIHSKYIAKMWKLNPLNKFSRPYYVRSPTVVYHTLSAGRARFTISNKRYRLILIDFVWIHFNEQNVYTLHEVCIYWTFRIFFICISLHWRWWFLFALFFLFAILQCNRS